MFKIRQGDLITDEAVTRPPDAPLFGSLSALVAQKSERELELLCDRLEAFALRRVV